MFKFGDKVQVSKEVADVLKMSEKTIFTFLKLDYDEPGRCYISTDNQRVTLDIKFLKLFQKSRIHSTGGNF